MKGIIIIIIFSLLLGKGFAQSDKWDNGPGTGQEILDKWMNLKFTPPEDYKKGYENSDLFNPDSRLAKIFQKGSGSRSSLTSPDGHLLMLIAIHRPLNADDSIGIVRLFPKHDFRLNVAHINEMKSMVKQMLGEDAAKRWREYATYYPASEAKNKFNADTVITCRFDLKKEEYHRGKYCYFQPLFTQKKGRGSFFMYLFYDKKGDKRLGQYMTVIENSLWYGDEEPEPPKDTGETIRIPYPKQQIIRQMK